MRLLPATFALLVATACGDDGGATASETTTGATTTSSSTTTTTGEPGSTSSMDSTGSSSDSDGDSTTTGEPQQPLCASIAVPLVVDRQAPVHDAASRARLAQFYDDLVLSTGAEVRIYPNAGAPSPPFSLCLQDSDEVADHGTLVWGSDFLPDPNAPAALDCVLDAIRDMPYEGSADGDWMFTGMMFPILDHADWPPAGTDVTLAMLLAQLDDDEGGMYPRPGMASEALVRLAAGGDRRRVAALTIGEDADELETFALSLGETSQYHDWAQTDLPAALDAWLPEAVHTCETFDVPPRPVMPGGCEHIDILFVVDGSVSMAEEQAALRGDDGQPPVFAEFTDALQAELTTLVDFHVGVVSSEPGDTKLHAYRDYPAQPPTLDTDCGLPPGQPWLVGPSPTLEQDFACIASTKSDIIYEETVANAAGALANPANAGFVRDDAVLVVVMLTDEDTETAGMTRVAVRQTILDAVDGELERLVVLAIAGDQGVFEMPKTTCFGPYGGAAPGRLLSDVVFSFRDQGIAQDICAGDLAQAFAAALDDVITTCENFHPEG